MVTRYPQRVDVIIIGSGPAGATYARVLSEKRPETTIAMFEAGPALPGPAGGHVKNIPDPTTRARAQRSSQGPDVTGGTLRSPGALTDGERRARPGTFLLSKGYRVDGEEGLPAAAMSSNVGGMGSHWTCACPRPGGQERIPFLADLDDLLAEGERVLGVTSHAFDDAPFAGTVRSRLAAALDADRAEDRRVGPMPLAVHRAEDGTITWSGSNVIFGDEVSENPNFHLHADSLVTRVLTDEGGVTGVHVLDRVTGGEHIVSAPYVVVAGDSLRTPQILFASGVRPRALGRWLNDQPQVVYAVRLSDVPAPTPAENSGAGVVAESGVSWVPYTDDAPFHGQVMQLDASPVPLAADDTPEPGSIVGLGWFCAKDLQESDRIEFSDTEEDEYGMPAMTIHYRLTEQDRSVIARASKTVREVGAALGTPLGGEPFLLPAGSSLHYQGSVRMGEVDDGASVCSPTSEVWGTPGLYVAGNGVIPTATACNPTLTSVALAVGGANALARRLAAAERTTSVFG